MQPFPFLNPACFSLNLLSTTLLSLLMIILARILLGMESRVIPRQLLQSFNAPFFGILIMVASFQSSGILFVFPNFHHEGEKNLCGNSWVCFEKLCIKFVSSRGFIVSQGLDGVDYFFLGGGWCFYLNSYWDVWLSFR